MLTEQQIIEAFISKINQPPDEFQIEAYKELSLEKLNEILDRRAAIENNVDPTYYDRLRENFQAYLEATPEQKQNWQRIRPIISPADDL